MDMTSTGSVATWLPAAIVRAAVVPAPTEKPGGRHRAPTVPGPFAFATPQDLVRRGRHAGIEPSRVLLDPVRDEVDSLSRPGLATRS
jgi:hypothetical protein